MLSSRPVSPRSILAPKAAGRAAPRNKPVSRTSFFMKSRTSPPYPATASRMIDGQHGHPCRTWNGRCHQRSHHRLSLGGGAHRQGAGELPERPCLCLPSGSSAGRASEVPLGCRTHSLPGPGNSRCADSVIGLRRDSPQVIGSTHRSIPGSVEKTLSVWKRFNEIGRTGRKTAKKRSSPDKPKNKHPRMSAITRDHSSEHMSTNIFA